MNLDSMSKTERRKSGDNEHYRVRTVYRVFQRCTVGTG
ncbi:hypothetical protein LAC1533_0506 [Ligilactobacillus acidipiscis]|uniref:Uncharacterized protein n=1 Tax=Ligilactobacillus acidipiscis TaxID=89059 RepID=A0A1K1KM10_9LACO|nr:hypothetical protein LAC1533_0506 [Ligilactobacillus acidipiscis]